MDFSGPILAGVFATWSPCFSRVDVDAGCARACLQYPWCDGYAVGSSGQCLISGAVPDGSVCGTNVSVYHSGEWYFRNASDSRGCVHGTCYLDETYENFPLTDADGPVLHVVLSGAFDDPSLVLVNRSKYTNVSGAVTRGTIEVGSGVVNVTGGLRTIVRGGGVSRVRSAVVVAAGDPSREPIAVELDVEVSGIYYVYSVAK